MSRSNNFNGFGSPVSLYGNIIEQTKWIKQGRKWKKQQKPITNTELEKLKADYFKQETQS